MDEQGVGRIAWFDFRENPKTLAKILRRMKTKRMSRAQEKV
jgi:uncharacterized protein with von Willebrand factor type A (vWA) domain